ncbi:hypothetical protein JCM19237_6554 [Photobacterium aphoticum]|uniref:Golvesin/Xly CBD-like domain-containing protein n=1 Tax=Photobacterium aphoticum TaxID=754436 RepID=A0A090QKI5_9GAMM|nr:hypothetical protein JCM19237_6554 [Photobacterium aphoticum]
MDEDGRYSPWTDKTRFYVDDQLADAVPTLRWLKPQTDLEVNMGEPLTLAWVDEDPDSSASVDLYYTHLDDALETQTKGNDFSLTGAGWVEVNAGDQGAYYVLLPTDDTDTKMSAGANAAKAQAPQITQSTETTQSAKPQSESAQAKWRMAASMAGYYEIQAFWPTADYDYPQTVSYTVTDTDKVATTVTVQPTEGWVSLGVFSLAEGEFTLQLNTDLPVNYALGQHILADKARMLPLDSPNQLMVSALNEDDVESRYQWDTHSLNPGMYKVTAIIRDDVNSVVVQSPATIKVNEPAYLLVDDASASASLDKLAYSEERASGYIGHGYHVMDNPDAANVLQSAWRLSIREDGWYALAFHDLPGFDNEALSFRMSSQYVDQALPSVPRRIETESGARWASLGKYWLKAGHYEINAQLERPARAAIDAIKVQKVAGASRTALEVDNHSIDFTASGAVDVSQQYAGYQGDDYSVMCPGIDGHAAWDVELHHEGLYEVFTNWSAHQTRASNARYTVYHQAPQGYLGQVKASLLTSLLKNQRENGGEWQSLGVFHFDAGMATVSVNNQDANGCVVLMR